MASAMDKIITAEATTSGSGHEDLADSLQQPIWHVFALGILTCLAYPFYWFYKTWRDLSQAAGNDAYLKNPALKPFTNISPLLRSIGLLVPILHLYLALMLFKGIAELHPNSQSLPRRHPLFCSGVLVALMLICFSLTVLPDAWYLCSFAAVIPLCVAQSWLNSYWRSVEPIGLNVRHAFSGKELLCIIVGSLLLGLVLASFWLVPGTAGGAH
jgi:hypothetical protein